jgi:hypothetical protein
MALYGQISKSKGRSIEMRTTIHQQINRKLKGISREGLETRILCLSAHILFGRCRRR